MNATRVYAGEALAAYGFPAGHPFSLSRYDAFWAAFEGQQLAGRCQMATPVRASEQELALFHTPEHIARVKARCAAGVGLLDSGDTPVFPHCFEAASDVVGSALDAARSVISGACRRAFVPIAGLHHARRDAASGFCVFNDLGVVIEWLFQEAGLNRVAYIDIDAHHGDGVFYAFEDEPRLIFADIHEDGRYLYPGTGAVTETGRGAAEGLKLNVPMPPDSDDTAFERVWPKLLAFIQRQAPEIILLQAGADSVQGDPITHMAFSPEAHRRAAADLAALADRACNGRMLAVGGGGYNLNNVARTWPAVIEAML